MAASRDRPVPSNREGGSWGLGPAWAVAAAYLGAAAWALLDARRCLEFAAKEGALEAVSHGALAAAAVVWAMRGTVRPRWLPVAVAGLLLIVLGEELDWGAVVGFVPIADALRSAFGHANLHNALGGASYLLFAVPWIAWFAAPWVPPRILGTAAVHLPHRGDAFAFGVIAAAAVASTLLPVAWEGAVDELGEALLYALLLWVGLRRPTL